MSSLKGRDRGGLYELHFLNDFGAFFFSELSRTFSVKKKLKYAAFASVKKILFFVFQTQISNCKSGYRYFSCFSLYILILLFFILGSHSYLYYSGEFYYVSYWRRKKTTLHFSQDPEWELYQLPQHECQQFLHCLHSDFFYLASSASQAGEDAGICISAACALWAMASVLLQPFICQH